MRLSITLGPDRNSATFNVDKRIGYVKNPIYGYRDAETCEQVDMCKAMFFYPGISSVNFGAHSITVVKGEIFTWDEIILLVKKVLITYIASKDEELIDITKQQPGLTIEENQSDISLQK